MADYDPKKNRRPAVDHETTADLESQVDAILDRTSDGDVAVPDEVLSIESPVVDLRNDRSGPIRADDTGAAVSANSSSRAAATAPPPDRTTQRVALVAGMAAATTAAIWLLRRSRTR